MNNKKVIMCFLAVIIAIVTIILISFIALNARKKDNSYSNSNYNGVEIVNESLEDSTPDNNVSNGTSTSTVVALDDEVLSQY